MPTLWSSDDDLFAVAQPGCSTITIGLKTRRQVEENIAALNEEHTCHWPQIIATLEGD